MSSGSLCGRMPLGLSAALGSRIRAVLSRVADCPHPQSREAQGHPVETHRPSAYREGYGCHAQRLSAGPQMAPVGGPSLAHIQGVIRLAHMDGSLAHCATTPGPAPRTFGIWKILDDYKPAASCTISKRKLLSSRMLWLTHGLTLPRCMSWQIRGTAPFLGVKRSHHLQQRERSQGGSAEGTWQPVPAQEHLHSPHATRAGTHGPQCRK